MAGTGSPCGSKERLEIATPCARRAAAITAGGRRQVGWRIGGPGLPRNTHLHFGLGEADQHDRGDLAVGKTLIGTGACPRMRATCSAKATATPPARGFRRGEGHCRDRAVKHVDGPVRRSRIAGCDRR